MKTCKKCLKHKSLDAFGKQSRNRDGLSCWCKDCYNEYDRTRYRANPERERRYRLEHRDRINAIQKRRDDANPVAANKRAQTWRKANPNKVRESWLKRQYGLTLVEFWEIMKSQDYCCAICRTSLPQPEKRISYAVDHDHRPNGKVRGILL